MTYWSPQQESAMKQVERWMRDQSAEQVFYMGGYAGVGKTTLARHLVEGARRRWLFASFTGKASHVMRQKGCSGAQTIHSLIYRPSGETKATEIAVLEAKLRKLQLQSDETPDDMDVFESLTRLRKQLTQLHSEREMLFALWANSPLADTDVEGIVIDECSMVDDQLGTDLESFGKKILVLGDPAQLPPVGAGGRYTRRDPDIMLTEIHRQAKESGILRLATAVREGREIGHLVHDSTDDCQVHFAADLDRDEVASFTLEADQVLVGRNKTRRIFNRRHRELLGFKEPTPVPGDRLVCLRNDRQLGLFNGSTWRVAHCSSDIGSRTCDLEIESEDGVGSVRVGSWLHHMIGAQDELTEMGWSRRDLAEFDYANSLTVHKSQGSQWDDVVLFDEGSAFGYDVGRRWRYTGITRAARKLTVIL